MRKKITVAVSLLLCVVMLSLVNISASPVSEPQEIPASENIITVANSNTTQKVLQARFLNMLNHNFVYNNDFHDDQILVNNSVLALLDLSENGYVAENYVSDYIFNMYGIKINDFSAFNTEFEKIDGYVCVVPRGYTEYKHSILTVTDNLDGSYTVVTEVEIILDDGTVETENATTIFLKAEDSSFGFNIVYSEIGAVAEASLIC